MSSGEISGAHIGVAEDSGEGQGGEVGRGEVLDVSKDRTAFGFNPEDDVVTHPQTVAYPGILFEGGGFNKFS